ncbi:NLR family CARD domain-containing protein 3-like isoform X5 [Actinia tenebrosa]|uniref:NLR family CARD domain-containing protein 3-like isoform X4 n=1 Tax=Actinia tenebrosa TaxID=6105 RepID=A0A6P8IQM3_ACTTE|nr:NLR family CARD domain-containing protein 3-like isoform X4 [Actinia tenebrosa]XP_031569377.1 NLR family CARD domain-containing protein 3-like isoform X5 [Actinia tenebrosa]
MDTVKEFLAREGFNHFSFVVVIGSVVFGINLLGVFADIEDKEQRYFSCKTKGQEDKDFLQRTCFADYQAKNTRGFPLYGFVLLNVLLVIMVCFFYYQSVRSKLEDLEREDPEMQTNQSTLLYRRYCIQLAVRLTLGMVFRILQWIVLYPLNFPSKYACELSSDREAKHTNITSSDAANVTRSWYHCINEQAEKKTNCTIAFFAVNVIFNVFILLELIYVIIKAKINVYFREDLEFFNTYLLNKPKVTKKYVAGMKEKIKNNTKFYEPLLPNIPGEDRKLLELDKIYTNLIIYPGRVKHEFKGKRHEIFEGYLRSQESHQSINKIENIFAPEPGNPRKRPLSIMIIGRPGVGKSLLCLRILRDWACGKTFNEEAGEGKCFEFVYLFKFRHFNSDEKINLQQLLKRGHFAGAVANEVYQRILSHPEKVLLIFDGLDEFGKKENIVKEEEFGNNLAETLPFSALYSKLTLGKLFKGATVVTTSRPTALSYVSFPNKTFDRTLEILGFNSEQIATYVERFCEDFRKQKIWNHIRSNANLLSLCYIPVNCHIVCFSLQERLKRDEDNDVDYLPTTLTEIYEDALVLIVCKHNPQYRRSPPEQEKLLSSRYFDPEVEKSLNSLGEIAYKGIKEDRLIFESSEVKKHEESGLLHRLPNQQVDVIRHKEQYCFLHLTIQELLAARYIIKGKSLKELKSWISKHLREGKWEVVMQFVAGLLHHEEYVNSIVGTFITSLPPQMSGEASWPHFSNKELVIRLFKCIFEISRNSKNQWKSLVAENLSGVVNLDLSLVSLTDGDMTAIAFVLQEIKSIVSVDVSRNHITSIGWQEMYKLRKMSGCKLTTLNISDNQIGVGGLKHLPVALATNECKLTTLNIRNNQIGVDGLKHLSDALATNECKLTTLDIRHNQIGVDGLKHLSDALATNECKLTTLDISDNQIGVDGLKHLSVALATNECKLTRLNISYNQIGVDGLKHLSDLLATNECKLTTLGISGNRIGDDGLKHLSVALATNECKLTTLDIRHNQIGVDGLNHLSDALATNKCKLTTLDIRSNRIDDNGLKHLSVALATNECKLTTLDISCSQISVDGLKHLSDALATNECKLTTLDIRDSSIGDNGLKHLSVALATNECKLTTLDISGNQISVDGLKHLSEALATNKCKLTTLDISHNPIFDDEFKHLRHFFDAPATNNWKLKLLT